jgi:adenine phosphoribosyltransferase
MNTDIAVFKNAIRDIPDFPKKGIIFKDITTLLADAALFRGVIDAMADRYRNSGIQKIACIESRGFILGAALAYALGAGVVPIRKKGKLPSKTVSCTYKLEYGEDTLEMHADGVLHGEKVLIIDDLLATGGTAAATAGLIKKQGASIVGVAFMIELLFLEGRKKLEGYDIFSLIQY